MNLSLKEQLRNWKRKNHVKSRRRKSQERKRKDLTENEIKCLMGMNMPVYRKYRGSYRQR